MLLIGQVWNKCGKYENKMIKLQKDQAAAIKSQSEVWLNSGGSKGFLGIGGSHSEGVKIKNQIKEPHPKFGVIALLQTRCQDMLQPLNTKNHLA